ncbi:hypothetical protein Tco_0943644, partial [Tanacetum coccineum]
VTEVSLLIQNKGKGLLDVDISAPDFIRLDKTKVQIQENDDQKVMVSIGDGRREKDITLKTSEGIVGLTYAFVNYRQNKGAKYQKLDAELPVSGGPKLDFDQKDGWNDNWSDDWGDDVEAPHTPSMPLTPSISSAGVSSRRGNHTSKPRHVDGVRLTKPKPNYYYRPRSKKVTTQPINKGKDESDLQEINSVSLQNSFDALMEKDKIFEVNNETRKANNVVGSTMDDSDSEKVKYVFVKDNEKPMDDLVIDARKKVEISPKELSKTVFGP